ncbi:MAG: DUF3179 domain-containing protein, partial [Gemmatimonadetes bacterium]|nr:DUF3179 domain-containing protein [Gemmatimonadota bacterium]
MTDGRRVVALVGVVGALAVMAWVILRGDGSAESGDAAETAGGERSPVELRGYEPATPALLAAAGWRTEIANPAALARVRISSVSRDDFVPIRDPLHARADETDLAPEEPVLIVRGETEVRAWPLVWLLERELVVDEVDGVPVVATFCSVCGTSRVWERRTE